MTNTLAQRELVAMRNHLTVLQNVVAADRLDMIAPSVARIEISIQRLESIESLVDPLREPLLP
jgi:hypothetical protein